MVVVSDIALNTDHIKKLEAQLAQLRGDHEALKAQVKQLISFVGFPEAQPPGTSLSTPSSAVNP